MAWASSLKASSFAVEATLSLPSRDGFRDVSDESDMLRDYSSNVGLARTVAMRRCQCRFHRAVAFIPRMALNGVMASRHLPDYRTLASLSRVNLLHELQERGAKTITELAEATGLHHNTAREHLHRLIDAGFVDSEPVPTVTKGRPKLRYRAARGADNPARQARLESAERRTMLVRRMLPVADVTEERTPKTRQLDALEDHMDQCGFDAEIDADNTHMVMHDCPFADIAKDNPQVCQVHFALVQDALDVADGPLQAKELHPFAAPKLCTVDLAETESDSE